MARSRVPASHEPAGASIYEPSSAGSVMVLISLAIAYLYSTNAFATLEQTSWGEPQDLAKELQVIAIIIAVGYALMIQFEIRRSIRCLFRVDLGCLGAIYFLTLFEFMFPQEKFNILMTARETAEAVDMVILGIAGIVVARHGRSDRKSLVKADIELNIKIIHRIFWLCFLVGTLHMTIATFPKIWDIFYHITSRRFAQPWGRGRFGTLGSLIYELGLLLYAIPPIGAYLISRGRELGGMLPRLCVILAVFFVLFAGFSSGTRNIFASYLALFVGTYIITVKDISRIRLILIALGAALLFIWSQDHMLKFRQMGLRRYIEEGPGEESAVAQNTIFVDYNLVSIGKLTSSFPEKHDYLYEELPIWCMVKPIPRGLWSGKPKGLSISVEKAVGQEHVSLSATFVGEAYMGWGALGVALASVFFGRVCYYWNLFGRSVSGYYSLIIYCSGLFAALISMRSMIWFTTAILPTIALIVIGIYLKRPTARYARQLP